MSLNNFLAEKIVKMGKQPLFGKSREPSDNADPIQLWLRQSTQNNNRAKRKERVAGGVRTATADFVPTPPPQKKRNFFSCP